MQRHVAKQTMPCISMQLFSLFTFNLHDDNSRPQHTFISLRTSVKLFSKTKLRLHIAAECIFSYDASALLADWPMVCKVCIHRSIQSRYGSATHKPVFHANEMQYSRHMMLHQSAISMCCRDEDFVIGLHTSSTLSSISKVGKISSTSATCCCSGP